MASASEVGYEPSPDFQQDAKDPLIELSLTDSSELWLIQWPINQTVGKISRRVSLIHYPEPSELQKDDPNKLKQMYDRPAAILTSSVHRPANPTQSIRSRHLQSESGFATSSRDSGRRSSLYASEHPLKPPKRRHLDEPTGSIDQLAQASEQNHNVTASSGSLGHSQERKSKMNRKYES